VGLATLLSNVISIENCHSQQQQQVFNIFSPMQTPLIEIYYLCSKLLWLAAVIM
jgi:hypothetical protein